MHFHPHTHTPSTKKVTLLKLRDYKSARDYKPSQNPLTSLRSDRTSMHKLKALLASFYLFTARAIASKCASSPSFLFSLASPFPHPWMSVLFNVVVHPNKDNLEHHVCVFLVKKRLKTENGSLEGSPFRI